MAHRGRLNVQANILKRPYEEIFSEFEHCYDPQLVGAGDVKYHNGYLADLTTVAGNAHSDVLVNNPSHLEAVNPVVEGNRPGPPGSDGRRCGRRVAPVLLHGDAAFAGQGVVAETLNMSQLTGYRTGGTVHVVINNQIGYTTLPEDARSTRYATDVAKMLMVPVFHVHGEIPKRWCTWPAWPPTTDPASARTWSSTWSATGATATTRRRALFHPAPHVQTHSRAAVGLSDLRGKLA
jgi:2-oxoglutarate dehydrogenase E1 component